MKGVKVNGDQVAKKLRNHWRTKVEDSRISSQRDSEKVWSGRA